MFSKHRLFCSVAFGALAIASPPAFAQSVNGQIDQLQQQVQDLQQQLQSLQSQVRSQSQAQAQAQQAATAQAAAKSEPHVAETKGHRFGLESADGQNSIYLTGRLHFDMGDYLDYHKNSKSTTPNDLNSGVNARRARIGVVGTFAGDWDYGLIADFGGSTDVGGPSYIENAYVTYNGFKKAGTPLAFDLGYIDTPFTLDEATSSNDIMFMERSSAQVIATEFGAGDNRSAFGLRSNDDRYWLGLYGTGPTSGATHTTGEPYAIFGRFTYQLLQGPDYSLHLGVNALQMLKAAGPTSNLTLSDRPELRIDPTSLLSTGALSNVSGGGVYGVEAAAGYQSLYLQGEYFHYVLNRKGLSSNAFNGGYVEGSWTLTGEHRKYNPTTGAYSGITPDHPFALSGAGFGAFELAARYSEIDLDDAIGGANAVVGGRQTVYTLGLNWYPNANVRFMLDYLHGTVHRSLAGTDLGANFDAIAARTQIAF